MEKMQSRIVVKETLNFTQAEQHMHLWISELGHSADKTDRLIAATAMREYTMLKTTLLSTLPVNSMPLTTTMQDLPNDQSFTINGINRVKRNIIGDFLNYVGGVATEDQLKKQLIIDKEIREKITNTLTRQLSFEHTIAAVYSNLTQEEDALHRKLDDLIIQTKKNKAHTSKLSALLHVANNDIQNMEDCLSAIWHQQASPRQAARLTAKAGLKVTPLLQLAGHSSIPHGVLLEFHAYTYKTILVNLQNQDTYLLATTADTSYYLHLGHPVQLPISVQDALAQSGRCDSCAVAVHTSDGLYKIVRAGSLACSHDNANRNYTEGDRLYVHEGTRCWNEILNIEPRALAMKEYLINLGLSEVEMDGLILQKELGDETVHLEDPRSFRARHTMNNLKLQQELKTAQQGLSTFIATTKTDMSMSFGNSGHFVTWGILGVTTPILLAIVAGILWRCRVASSSRPAPPPSCASP